MKTTLIQIEDLNGACWRLSLDVDPVVGHPLVNLECLYGKVVEGWVHIKFVTRLPKEVGVEWRSEGVTMVDGKVARAVLVKLMAEHNTEPRPSGVEVGLSMMETLPGAGQPLTLDEPELEAHHRVNLLEYLQVVEAAAAIATSGIWRAADGSDRSLGAILDAIITGGPADPVAESMTHVDMMHVLTTQPLAAGALVRKLREAFYLLQDLAKAVLSLRGEIDHLSSPKHRTHSYATRIDMFDRYVATMQERCAVFPTIQIPDYGHVGQLVSQAPQAGQVSRDDLVRLARTEALREGSAGSHDYLPKNAADANRFEPHQWVIWAMLAAVEYVKNGSVP